MPEVRLVGPNGEQVGIVPLEKALQLAQDSDLDLVEVAAQARPPVAKLMDYGKFKYETALKAREARKKGTNTVIKEMKLRPKIDPHDYETKKGHVARFLNQGDKVKITIMFRGREQHRPELGLRLLSRLAGEVEELGFVESSPKQDGRNMIMVLGPHRKKSEAKAEREAAKAERKAQDEANAHVRRSQARHDEGQDEEGQQDEGLDDEGLDDEGQDDGGQDGGAQDGGAQHDESPKRAAAGQANADDPVATPSDDPGDSVTDDTDDKS